MRMVYILGGVIAFALGTVGTVLPVLPTVPFYLFATWCFAKSSRRLHDWLHARTLYQKHMTPFFNGEGLSIRQKVTMMDEIVIGRIVLVCAWIFHVFYFLFRIKTRTVQ